MIAEKILAGMPLDDVFVFDVHGHCGKNAGTYMTGTEAEEIIATMDKLGVNGICLSSCEAIDSDFETGNEAVKKMTEAYPGRIYGYVLPTPYYEYDLSKYFYPGSGILGIKIHAMHQHTEIKSKKYAPAYELADKLGLPVLFHAWEYSEAKQAVEVAAKYKNAKIILGHSAMTSLGAKLAAIDGIKKYENVFVDTAISSTYEGAIEWIVSRVGAERVLYGSDIPYFDCRQTFGKLALSRLSERDKIKIYGENAGKIFGLK